MPPPRVTRANVSIFWGVPSSYKENSAEFMSVTGRPFRSRTTTSTRMAVVADEKDWPSEGRTAWLWPVPSPSLPPVAINAVRTTTARLVITASVRLQ